MKLQANVCNPLYLQTYTNIKTILYRYYIIIVDRSNTRFSMSILMDKIRVTLNVFKILNYNRKRCLTQLLVCRVSSQSLYRILIIRSGSLGSLTRRVISNNTQTFVISYISIYIFGINTLYIKETRDAAVAA